MKRDCFSSYLGLSPIQEDFHGSSIGKECAGSAGDPGSIPGLGRSCGEGNGKPIPVFLPGKSHGQRKLVGYSPWGYKSWTQLGN